MKNGKDKSDPLAATREAIAELEGSVWEEEEPTGETHVHVAPGGHVVVDQTGRFQALAATPTRPDNPAPPDSGTLGPPPDQRLRPLAWLLSGVPKEHRVWVILALLAFLAFAIWRGAVGILG